jgi:hypothetical protein
MTSTARRPRFTVKANGERVAVGASWSCRIEDGVGVQADRCELQLDASSDYGWPTIGAELEVAMGYVDDGAQLDVMGRYIVDGVRLSGLPWTLTVSAHAGDLATTMAEQRARAWVDLTLGEIAQDIGDTAGVRVLVSDAIAGRKFGYLEQRDESDAQLLTRIAKRLNVVAKPMDGAFVIAPRHEAKSVRGTPMGSVTVKRDAFMSAELSQAARGALGAIACKLRPLSSGRDVAVLGPGPVRHVKFGSGQPVERIQRVFATRDEAQVAADAYRAARTAPLWKLRGSIIGDTRVAAEMRIKTPDLHPETPSEWTCTRASHSIGRGGYTTEFEAESKV